MTDHPMLERAAEAIGEALSEQLADPRGLISHEPLARAALTALLEPGNDAWDGLARQLVMWMDFSRPTPRRLFDHLKASGHEIPQWLRDEPEMQNPDHVPSKGTRAVLVFTAMINRILKGAE